MARISSNEADEKQPLLSGTAHDHDHHPQQNERDNGSTNGALWLQRLVFKARLRFAISLVVVFYILWTLVALLAAGDHRSSPWTKAPDYSQHPGFLSAMSRLSDQPFCYPEVDLLTVADTAPSRHGWGNQADSTTIITDVFDKLAGSVVRELPGLQRRRVEWSMSLVEGEPFYTRIASSDNSSSANSKATFRSSQLWRALQLLSTQASRSTSSNEPVSIEELIEALQLNHTSVVSVPNKHPALKTTLRDVQHLLQTLLGNHHNVLPSLPAVGLDSLGVRNYFSPYALATDGVMASTHSGLTLVRQGTSSHGALRAVGTHGFAMSLQQWNRKLDTLFLVEVEDGKELTIAINLERGLTSIILTDLIESTAAENEGEDKTTSMGEWIRIWFGNAVLLFDWAHEDWMDQNWAGTYRYQRHAEDAEGTQFNWIEVDVQIDERVPWITRIEYSAYPNDTSSRTTSSPSTSVLKKYNVGGTSDFLAGWTCQLSPESLSRCYRPLVGDDEGHCRCRGYRRDGKTISHNRVGLWPSKTRKLDGGRMWTIPQGTIRRDGSSYMDQGLGGCHALWKFDAEQTVPEMQHLGYHVQFVEGKDQLKWLLPGLVMDRVRK